MTDDHAKYISDKYESGEWSEKASTSKRDRMARTITSLLDTAELAAKRGDEAGRDEALAKAQALQLKYVINDLELRAARGDQAEEIIERDFVAERKTAFVRARRELVWQLALLNNGNGVLMSRWNPEKNKLEQKAYVRIYAHQSDMDFISSMYNSLVIQMQSMLANDEDRHRMVYGKPEPGWRLAYSRAWVERVCERLWEAKRRNERTEFADKPGTALVLRDRKTLVDKYFNQQHPSTRATSRYSKSDRSTAGRAAGRAAAERADLGQTKVGSESTRRIGT